MSALFFTGEDGISVYLGVSLDISHGWWYGRYCSYSYAYWYKIWTVYNGRYADLDEWMLSGILGANW